MSVISAEQPNSFKVLEPVLVLGARGMLGSEICRQLAVRGQRFVAGISSESDEPYRVTDREGKSTEAETAVYKPSIMLTCNRLFLQSDRGASSIVLLTLLSIRQSPTIKPLLNSISCL